MQDFIAAINASQNAAGNISFNRNSAISGQLTQSYVTVIAERGFIQVQGVDAAKFLQGQITCDVNEVTQQQIRFGAHCTHKGRMIASFIISQIADDTYLLQLPKNNVDALLASLNKYIVFSKAQASDVSANWVCLGLSGDTAAQALDSCPSGAYQQTLHKGVFCHQLPNGQRFELNVPSTQATAVFTQASTTLKPADSLCWQLENIRSGIAEIITDTTEVFIPQAINLQAINGVSFTKGCYTGQEIVARMKYLGKQKRHMARFSCDGEALAPGSNVFTSANNKNIGEVVNCVATANNHCEGLAVVVDDALNDDIVSTNPLQVLHFTQLDYDAN